MQLIKFKDFIQLQRGFDLPKNSRKDGSYPVIASTKIDSYHTQYKVDGEGVITGRSGALGEVQYFVGKYWPLNTTLWVKDFKGNYPKFVYYFLKTLNLSQYNSGAGVPTLNRNHLDELDILIPLIQSQIRIASILSAYDDLIENNNRRIAILEEMARSLYREWFVKFLFPGHEEVKMVDSELGQIPDGWRIVQISDIYKTSSGGTPSRLKPEYYNGEIQWVKTKELRDGFVVECEETISELGLIKSSAKLFPKHTVLMAMYGATIGQLGIISKESASNQACCAIIAIDEIFSPWYIYLNLLSNRTYIIGQRMGAAQQNISQQIIKDLKVIQPDSQTMQKFNQIVESIFFKIENLQKKNNNLKTQLDMLLPKLISGKIEV